jgi:hypothetical protein
MRSTILLFAILSSTTATACVTTLTYQRYSSGSVGCPPAEVEISDQQESMTSSSWTATCRGQRFYCSVPAGGGSATCTKEASR